MKNYDYIIAGGGCAGLSLAYYLCKSKLAKAKVLIIDRAEKIQNDRTWCFWTNQPTAFDAIVSKKWQFLSFRNAQSFQQYDLKQGTYKLIRSDDFYRFTKNAIQSCSNFQWLQATVSLVAEDEQGPFVVANGATYRAQWVFSSCFDWQNLQNKNKNKHFLLQHFRGWVIKTPMPAFDASTATLMDFRTQQCGNTRFFYVLPFSPKEALVEYTIFSKRLEPQGSYEQELRYYIKNQLQIENYEIIETEQGVIPMADVPLPKPASQKIIYIGTPGGAVKPTTGYAFLRIQQQTQLLARCLESTGAPFLSLPSKRRFRFYDQLLLDIMEKEGDQVQEIFTRLFQNNRISTILKFLDEATDIWQDLSILLSLPFKPFLRSLMRIYGWKWKYQQNTVPTLQPIIGRRFK